MHDQLMFVMVLVAALLGLMPGETFAPWPQLLAPVLYTGWSLPLDLLSSSTPLLLVVSHKGSCSLGAFSSTSG
jgi:hypothetical protein